MVPLENSEWTAITLRKPRRSVNSIGYLEIEYTESAFHTAGIALRVIRFVEMIQECGEMPARPQRQAAP
jgi:hypothetical protein